MPDTMDLVTNGFLKQASAGVLGRIAALAKRYPKLSVGLATGSAAGVGGGLLGYQAHKAVGSAGHLDPNATHDQLRQYKADRFGNY